MRRLGIGCGEACGFTVGQWFVIPNLFFVFRSWVEKIAGFTSSFAVFFPAPAHTFFRVFQSVLVGFYPFSTRPVISRFKTKESNIVNRAWSERCVE